MYVYDISLNSIGLFVIFLHIFIIFRMMTLRVVGRSWCLAAGGGTGPLRRHSPLRPPAAARRIARPLRTSSSFRALRNAPGRLEEALSHSPPSASVDSLTRS
jgi:hypothetical protein